MESKEGVGEDLNNSFDSMTLADIWKVISHHKILVLGCMATGILISVIFLLLMKPEKPIWKAESLIAIDNHNKNSWNPDLIKSYLRDSFPERQDSLPPQDILLYQRSIRVRFLPPNFADITVEGYSWETANKFANIGTSKLGDLSTLLSENELNRYRSDAQETLDQIERVKRIRESLLALPYSSHTRQSSLTKVWVLSSLLGTYEKIDVTLSKLENRLKDDQQKIRSFNVKKLIVHIEKIPPKISFSAKRQIVEASGFLGLLLGISTAFIRHFYQKKP